MKLIIIILISLLVFCNTAIAEIPEYLDTPAIEKAIFNEMRPVIISNNSDGWEIKGLYFNSILKERADSVVTWNYEEKGKKIGFMHQKTAWDTGLVIAAGAFPSKGIINSETTPIKVTYDDAIKRSVFGTGGINVEIIQDNYRWQKIIEIESLESLGNIPTNAEYLEISFLMFDNFKIQNGIIEKPILFGENSYLQPVRAWDSSGDPDNSGAVGVIAGTVITKRIPVAWLRDALYPVQTDLTITYGAENIFNSADTQYPSVAALNSTHFVVAYQDIGNSNFGTAIVGVISGTTISSYGAENVFNSANTQFPSVAALSSTHFVVAYKDVGNLNYGTAIVGVISGTTISSYGAENVFNSANTQYPSVAALSSTHFVVGYRDVGNSDYGTAIVGLVSGTTISSYGAENVFNSATTSYISVEMLDNTHFVVGYQDVGNSNYGTAIVGLVSGTTISSYGAENVFNSASTDYISVARLDATHFIVGYRDGGNSNYGTAIVGLVSGTTISSYGAENVFNSAATYYTSVAILDATHFIVGYRDAGNSNYGTAIVGLVSGTTISSYGAENVFNSATTSYISVETLDSTHFVVAYRDGGNLNYGTAIVGEVIEPPAIYIPPNPTTLANTTGNFWVNHTWAAGSGNVTDGYNVTINSVWHNGTDTFYNDTYSAHAWQNITVYAFNSTGAGTLSSGSVGQDTQIPNNLITITNTSDWSGDEGENVYVDYDATDVDSDTPTFSCNRTDLFADFSTTTGKGNWTSGYTDSGVYYVEFGVSDGYDSMSNYTMTLTVNRYGFPGIPITLSHTKGTVWVNHTWAAGSGNVTNSYNVSINDTWHNGSTNTYYNNTPLSSGDWSNIIVWAWNNTYNELSITCVSENVQTAGLYHPFLQGAYYFYNEMRSGLTDFRDSMGRYFVWGIIFFAVGLAFTLFAKLKQTLIGGK